jgi:hypothetical protein
MTDPPSALGPPPSPVTLAVVRQDQMGAFAVVTGSGQEMSLLPGPQLAGQPRLLTGELVAVRGEWIVYRWYRALVLRATPEGVRVRLGRKEQVVLPVHRAALPDADTLRPGEPVWADRDEIVARAWPWYEPLPPSPALQALAEARAMSAEC